MIDRLVGLALALLAVAGAIYVSVRLVESVATQLAVIGALLVLVALTVLVVRALWRANRW